MNQNIRDRLKLIHRTPGVYIMKNIDGKIIYIGKANNLKQRITSYFQPSSLTDPKVRKIVKDLYDFDYIITSSEMEALILECNLIKEHLPRYNVKFKDGRGYPYIKITVQENFPRMEITRKVLQDGARYYGPYTMGLKNYLKLFLSLFPLRSCKGEVKPDPNKRPCLNYHIKKCTGACLGEINEKEYGKIVEEACRFLEGKHQGLIQRLKNKIKDCVDELKFEQASVFRDQLFALQRYSEKQKVVFSSPKEEGDFIGTAREDTLGCVEIYFLREGRIVGQERFLLDITEENSSKEMLSAFIKQFYIHRTDIPSSIYVEEEVEENLLEEWLASRRDSRVKLIIPKRGKKKELIEMAKKNAEEHIKLHIIRNNEAREKAKTALMELKTTLNLPSLPVLIEAFDISNISGKDAVGSMVVFEGGIPKKSSYRKYKIKSIATPNDFAMMEEIIKRRYGRLTKDSGEAIPDLILVDGGKGQLGIALKVMKELNINLSVIALAKEEEVIFKPGISKPIMLKRNSSALHLVQRIRDEAHRFAITYHRKIRQKRTTISSLDGIPGIGSTRKRELLRHFGSIENIRSSNVEEIASVEGMNKKIAEILYEKLGIIRKGRL